MVKNGFEEDISKLHAVRRLKGIIEKWWGVQINFLDSTGHLTTRPRGQMFAPLNSCCKQIITKDRGILGCLKSLQKDANKTKALCEKSMCHASFSTLCVPLRKENKNIGYIYCDGFVLEKTEKTQKKKIESFLKKSEYSTEEIEKLLAKIPVIKESALDMIKELLTEIVQEIFLYHQEACRDQKKIDSLEGALKARSSFSGIIGKSDLMQDLYRSVDRIKDVLSTVLIEGEHGTGKELVARALHYRSHKKEQSFVAVNCGAISTHILESELFGHVRGAFTGATVDRKGFFEEATKGTLFLDEIGEMPLSMQVKLLRVLQNKVFIPVGGTKEKTTGARVVCATNRHLEKMIKAGTFREDLFYRLHVIHLQVPALRERKEDIPLLVEFFMERNRKQMRPKPGVLDKDLLMLLMNYHWPGNIRELENEIERLCVLSGGEQKITKDFASQRILEQNKKK